MGNYDLHKLIRSANRQFQPRLESQTNYTDTHAMWKGFYAITGYNESLGTTVGKTASLPEMLNAFYVRFEWEGSLGGGQ